MRYSAYAWKLKTSEQHKIAYQFVKEFCEIKYYSSEEMKMCSFFISLDYIHTILRAALKLVLQKHYIFSRLSLSSFLTMAVSLISHIS